jgi:hypothetical protein
MVARTLHIGERVFGVLPHGDYCSGNIVTINFQKKDKHFSGDELNEPVCIQLDDDFEEFGVRGEMINIDNQYIYQIVQNKVAPNKDNAIVCYECHRDEIDGDYPYYCPEWSENLYEFEVEEKNVIKNYFLVGAVKQTLGGFKYYQLQNQTACMFKDEKAYRKQMGICYIPNSTFEDEDGDLMDFIKITPSNFEFYLNKCDIYTHKSLLHIVTKAVGNVLGYKTKDLFIMQKMEFIYQILDYVFENISGQDPFDFIIREVELEKRFNEYLDKISVEQV